MEHVKTPKISDVRTKGQVWTPRWVADAMAAYLGELSRDSLLDPAVGPGILLAAAEGAAGSLNEVIAFEIDTSVLSETGGSESYARGKIHDLRLHDFLSEDNVPNVSAVIANPPYLRHHRMSPELKLRCREIVLNTLGISIDARAGLHVYFLVKALSHLKPGGKLSFLLPADTFEGVFATKLWAAISEKFNIQGILTFDSSSAAFPGVDTNASIVFIQRNAPDSEFNWLNWSGSEPQKIPQAVKHALAGKLAEAKTLGMNSTVLSLAQAIEAGFTRLHTSEPSDGIPLNEFATTMRGVATGNNDFFLMTRSRMDQLGLSPSHFVRTIPRVRDATEALITSEFLDDLDRRGRPTYLLSLDKDSQIDDHLQAYLKFGETSGHHQGALVSQRKHWYYMEKRLPVPILFAYLGRRNNRFIETRTDITPLTGFLCVYPKPGVNKTKLLEALNHPDSIKELARVGKSYGDGAIKVEPGGLRKMVIPRSALEKADLQ